MIVHRGPIDTWGRSEEATAIAIGVLDGVHVGHRALLAKLGDDLERIVLTFDPHPVEVLRPGSQPRLITTIDERLELLDSVGLDAVGVLDLGEIRELDARTFVADVLSRRLAVKRVVVGPDFRFGHDRAGDAGLLTELGDELGFESRLVDLVTDADGVVSSSRIREMIESGEVAAANRALGSRYRLTSEIVSGDKRGRELGFPTANLIPPQRKVLPAIGVYAAFALLDDVVHLAAVNVGVRPTFGGGEVVVEAFLLDYDEDIYGHSLTLEFVEYLRPELKFDSVPDLVARMGEDVAAARKILKSVTTNTG